MHKKIGNELADLYREILAKCRKLRYNKSILNESANYTNIIDQDEGVLPERSSVGCSFSFAKHMDRWQVQLKRPRYFFLPFKI